MAAAAHDVYVHAMEQSITEFLNLYAATTDLLTKLNLYAATY